MEIRVWGSLRDRGWGVRSIERMFGNGNWKVVSIKNGEVKDWYSGGLGE